MTIAYPKANVYSAPWTGKGTPNRMNVLETQEGHIDNSTKEGCQCQLDTQQQPAGRLLFFAIFEGLEK